MRTAIWEVVRAAPSSLEGAPGLRGVASLVRGDLTTEPPAHCRLVSGHDLFEIGASSDCTAVISRAGPRSGGKRECSSN